MKRTSVTRCNCCSAEPDKSGPLARSGNFSICRRCTERCAEQFESWEAIAAAPKMDKIPTPREIYSHLDQYVVSQHQAKMTLSVAAYNHYKRAFLKPENGEVEIEKSNVLLIGPTGSGKTLLARTLAKMLNVPLAIGDATALTEAGYVGEDVEGLLLKLLQAANFNIGLAERGIIYIDEIDKIGRKTQNVSITRDVSGEGVQQALLKIIEGTVANISPDGGRKHPEAKYVQIDTTNILFICGGAFVGLNDIIAERTKTKAIGFNPAPVELGLQTLRTSDLVKFGLIPEFIGRMPIVVSMDELTRDDLLSILTKPKNSIVKQYQELLKIDGVDLEFENDALDMIATKALQSESGARGLRTIIESLMQEVMFNAPDTDSDTIRVTSDMIAAKFSHRIAA